MNDRETVRLDILALLDSVTGRPLIAAMLSKRQLDLINATKRLVVSDDTTVDKLAALLPPALIKELCMPLYAYPTSLNQEAVLKMARAFTGELDVETAHASWDVAGFALSQFDANHKPIALAQAAAAAPLSHDECKAVLESLKDDGKAKALKIDWAKVLQVVMTILSLFAQPAPA